MKILYNPKRYNGAPSSDVKDVFMQKIFELKVNEMKQFEDQVADYLMKKFGFLEVVAPESVTAIKEKMSAGDFVCEHCNDEFDTDKALNMHKLGKHKLSKETKEILDTVPVAEPSGEVAVRTKRGFLTPDEQEGIPSDGKHDRDGVQWVGAGIETDNLSNMSNRVPGVTRGVFGG